MLAGPDLSPSKAIKLSFSNSNMTRFSCKLRCQRCVLPGCPNTTCVALPFCTRHLKEVCGLQLKKSGLHGRGIFAAGPPGSLVFQKGDKVAYFGGELLDQATLDRRYGEGGAGPYVASVSAKKALDGACLRSVGSMVNHGKGACANVKYAGRGGSLHMVAKRDIQSGEEIRVDYDLGTARITDTTQLHKTRGGVFYYTD